MLPGHQGSTKHKTRGWYILSLIACVENLQKTLPNWAEGSLLSGERRCRLRGGDWLLPAAPRLMGTKLSWILNRTLRQQNHGTRAVNPLLLLLGLCLLNWFNLPHLLNSSCVLFQNDVVHLLFDRQHFQYFSLLFCHYDIECKKEVHHCVIADVLLKSKVELLCIVFSCIYKFLVSA